MTALLEYLNHTLINCSWFLQYYFDPISSQPLKDYSTLTILVPIHSKFQLIPFSGVTGREVETIFLKSQISITHALHMVGVFVVTP